MISSSKPMPLSWRKAIALSLLIHGVLAALLAFVPLLVPKLQLGNEEGNEEMDLTGYNVYVCAAAPSWAETIFQHENGADAPAPPRMMETQHQRGSSKRNDLHDPPGHQPNSEPREVIQIVPASLTPAIKAVNELTNRGAGVSPAQYHAGGTPAPQSIGHAGSNNKHGTAFFQIHTKAKRVVYVLDRSLSMGQFGAFSLVRRELLASLYQLPKSASFQIIVYNSTARPLIQQQQGWLPATDQNRQSAAAALAQLDASGKTIHHDALPFALSLEPEVIFFLSDGDNLTPDYVQRVSQINKGRASIHVIQVKTSSSESSDSLLKLLAQRNHGIYRVIDVDP